MLQPTSLTTLKYRDLRRLRTSVRAEFRRRYPERTGPKYGLLNRGLSDQDVTTLLSHVTSNTARTIFTLCDQLGLRIGEAVKIKTTDIDLTTRRIWINSQKGSHPASLYLHDRIHTALEAHLTTQPPQQTYLFPSNSPTNTRGHVSPHWAAKEFREARAKAGLTMSYGNSNPCGSTLRERPLYRHSTHSFRHAFIQRVRRATGDIRLAQALARHKDIRSTIIYDHIGQEQMDNALQKTFSNTTP